jgi:hypothetical protein
LQDLHVYGKPREKRHGLEQFPETQYRRMDGSTGVWMAILGVMLVLLAFCFIGIKLGRKYNEESEDILTFILCDSSYIKYSFCNRVSNHFILLPFTLLIHVTVISYAFFSVEVNGSFDHNSSSSSSTVFFLYWSMIEPDIRMLIYLNIIHESVSHIEK